MNPNLGSLGAYIGRLSLISEVISDAVRNKRVMKDMTLKEIDF
jgi:hypothetical protein